VSPGGGGGRCRVWVGKGGGVVGEKFIKRFYKNLGKISINFNTLLLGFLASNIWVN
jgi:hypothetical protein